ncbi:hypothetical protein F3Y22_tig00116962pilonHSYRG01214 [Hibiscus syriacus]|uniref:Uncharacterized protein n=1 Tax=Hibiscus syriacus TaxID=106335 RepID=A0A6A2XCM8_HIBSY|nr:hypothetical protein F3Y22_tig00116962pilonHSYRG01214 [Hibiscus syriacus]
MASSGRAHDSLKCTDGRRAMLVCRVIAGRVERVADDAPPLEEDNSSSSSASTGRTILWQHTPASTPPWKSWLSSIQGYLPCFVVIYKALES